MRKEILAGTLAASMFVAGCGDSEVDANRQAPEQIETTVKAESAPSLVDLTPAIGAEYADPPTDEQVERSLEMWRQASQEVQDKLESGGGTVYRAEGYCALWETDDGNWIVANNPIVGVVNQPTPSGFDYLATPMFNYPRETSYFEGPSVLAGPYLFTSLSIEDEPEAMITANRNLTPSVYWLNTDTASLEEFPSLVLADVELDGSGEYWGIKDDMGQNVSETIFVDPTDPDTENRIAALCGVRAGVEEPAQSV